MIHKQALLISSLAFIVSIASYAKPANQAENLKLPPAEEVATPEPFDGPIIQLALLLDTSNSMDGLIDQARSRLWEIVNSLNKARVDGKVPQFQVALFQYGNSKLSKADDHVQLRCPFTTDLDIVSEQLFSLSTDGGQEYCGAVLRESLNQLDWIGTAKSNVLRVIVIAGNEPFNQGSEPFEEWTASARKKEIRVNTIFCGNLEEGRKTLWAKGADTGGGEYAAIDQNKAEVYIATPFDDALQDLNDALNGTYLGYGSKGRRAKSRQVEQDASNRRLSLKSFFSRASTKSSRNYETSSWCIVSAVGEDKIKIEDIKKEDLPEELAEMSPEELESHINKLVAERKRIQMEINKATVDREKFLANAKVEAAENAVQDLDDALIDSMKKQAAAEGFAF